MVCFFFVDLKHVKYAQKLIEKQPLSRFFFQKIVHIFAVG